ncbi:Protein SMAX1-LIKE 3 [Zea mays]|uniref:Protein SMAX1-LIKE 3 n=1 Tax=Zea mays TaxID=4577 RepID=A0A1D6EBE8_MAIZE|nr:Protein SMAX1-LIKE 3 [Zea mays]
MRAGGCTVQQSLTAEAAAVVKQAVSLARRRGNAQVTPLHVASAMLAAAPAGQLLRAACLRSHSHPLQCKALELCFNVALNRLPASASSPLLGGNHHCYHPPSLSNALVAAFKRAQAHQRRGGSVESQHQQPVVAAVKIELDQLVVSILDDPSVSRVMRDAGFSSTQVKANVEQAVCSSSTMATAAAAPSKNPNPSSSATTTSPPPKEAKAKPPLALHHQARDEDVAAVLDCLASRSKRRVVVIAESAAAAEAMAHAAVDKIKRGEVKHEHDALRGAQVVSLRVSSFREMPREEAERRLGELRCLVKQGRRQRVVLVVEDLKWAAEFWAGHDGQSGRRGGYYYCAVEHVVNELRALASGGSLCWLLGFGTYQAYTKCRVGQPSLESLWGLQTLTVPAGSLALSLTCAFDDSALGTVNQSLKAGSDADGNGPASCWPLLGGSQLSLSSRCCGDGDCSAARIDTKAALPRPSEPTTSHLTDLSKSKTWSSICSRPSQRMTLHFSAPVSPASSISSYEHGGDQSSQTPPQHSWLLAGLDAAHHRWEPKRETSGNKAASRSHDSGASNGGSVEVECRARFKELSAENLKLLCGALEKEVPWQKEIIPEVASAVLQCRSGIAKRRDKSRSADAKEETWMLFLGGDADGKERVARELASLVFGSRDSFLAIRPGASSSSPPRSGSSEGHRSNKRPRMSPPPPGEESAPACLERLHDAVSENPHRVIFMEGVEQAGRDCQLGIKEAIESGVVRNRAGVEVGVGDAIVVLSCEGFGSTGRSRACSPPSKKVKVEMEEAKEERTGDIEHNGDGGSSSSPSCIDLNVDMESDQADEGSLDDDVCLLTAVDRTLFFRRQG